MQIDFFCIVYEHTHYNLIKHITYSLHLEKGVKSQRQHTAGALEKGKEEKYHKRKELNPHATCKTNCENVIFFQWFTVMDLAYTDFGKRFQGKQYWKLHKHIIWNLLWQCGVQTVHHKDKRRLFQCDFIIIFLFFSFQNVVSIFNKFFKPFGCRGGGGGVDILPC